MASMRTIGVRLRLLTDSYRRDADEAAKATDKLGDSIGRTGKKSADLDAIATNAGLVGAALVGVAGAAIYAAASFDKQMSEVGAVAGATADEMAQLRQAALDAGAATVFSAKDAAQAEAELAKAGIKTSDILGGALTGSLSLAAAGSLDLATSAEIAAASMNMFGLQGRDVEHIADVLAAAANKSAAGVDDLGQGLQQVGLVANQVGFSLEETVGLLAAFADRGLKGSDGATSLKTALMRLAAPTDEAAETLKRYDISLYDASGNMVDAVTISGQLQRGLKDLGAEERNAALQTIFGSDAIRAANVMYGLGADGVREYIDAVDDQGAASRMAAEKLNNLAGDVEGLKGSLETLFIQAGSGANGGLRFLTQAATEMVNAFGALPAPVQGGAVVIAGLTGTVLLGTAAVLKLRSGLAEVIENLSATGPAGARAARGLELTVGIGTRLISVLAAVQIAGRLASAAFDEELNPAIDQLTKELVEWDRQAAFSGESARVLGSDFDDLADNVRALGEGGLRRAMNEWITVNAGAAGMSGGLDVAREKVVALDAALAQMVADGNADEAFGLVRLLADRSGLSVERVTSLLPAYQDALKLAGDEAEQQAVVTKQAAAANVALAGAFGEAANEADGLLNAYKKLNGGTLDLRESQREAEEAVDELAEALKESGGSLDITNSKGRAAAAAVDTLALKAAELAQKTYNQTGSVEQANAAYTGYIEVLRQTMLNAGMAEDEINTLIAAIGNMPTYKAVTIAINQTTTGAPYWQDYRAGERRRWGGVTVHAADGLLSKAAVFSPGPTRYAFAEPETGGEAFVPKRGDYGRSMSILSAAAGWYNADVVPRDGWYGGAGGAGGTVRVEVSAAPGSDRSVMSAITQALRFNVRTKGAGSVQRHLGKRGT